MDSPQEVDRLAHNKALVQAFFAALSDGRLADCRSLAASSAQWWTLRRRTSISFDLQMQRTQEKIDMTVAGLQFKVGTLTAEDNRVAVLVECAGQFRNGQHYHNLYNYLFEVSDGLVSHVWEYTDTAAADAAFPQHRAMVTINEPHA